jgi:hypothetical protein
MTQIVILITVLIIKNHFVAHGLLWHLCKPKENFRVYVIGGLDENGTPLSTCEKYNPGDNTWSDIAPLPYTLYNCNASFAPDYGKSMATTLGYIYVVGGQPGPVSPPSPVSPTDPS